MTATNLAESDMYDWRVTALMNWIDKNKSADGKLAMEKLSAAGHLEQYHYLGLRANDEVISILGLKPGMCILDVGCGIGGPARYIAWKSGCSITGVDIQSALTEGGSKVTAMVGLTDKVTLVTGDVLSDELFAPNSFDAFVSLLVILHIADRNQLFRSLFRSVKEGGAFLIDDMVALGEFDADQNRIAKEVIGSPYLPTIDEYRTHLIEAGFVDVEFEVLTPEWVQWCVDRSDQYDASQDDQIRMHGEKVFTQRSSFYADVKSLFRSGKLGGVRITGRKPSYLEIRLRQHRMGATSGARHVHAGVSIIETD